MMQKILNSRDKTFQKYYATGTVRSAVIRSEVVCFAVMLVLPLITSKLMTNE